MHIWYLIQCVHIPVVSNDTNIRPQVYFFLLLYFFFFLFCFCLWCFFLSWVLPKRACIRICVCHLIWLCSVCIQVDKHTSALLMRTGTHAGTKVLFFQCMTVRAWTGAELRFAGRGLVAMDGNWFDATCARTKYSFLAVEKPLTGVRFLKVRRCSDGSEGVEFLVVLNYNIESADICG